MVVLDAGGGCACARHRQAVDERDIDAILRRHGEDRSSLMSVLADVQARYRYLPPDALRMIAKRVGCSLVDLYGAATFYRSFSLKPKGEHVISVCLGTACHVRGAPRIAEEFERQLGIRAGETTSDSRFTLETVNCLGACALGPIVVVDGRYFSNVNTSAVKRILDGVSGSGDLQQDNGRVTWPLDVACPHCGRSLMDPEHTIAGQPSISLSGEAGWVRLSSLYGVPVAESEGRIEPDGTVRVHCPHCRADMAGHEECLECGAPTAELCVQGGGTLRACLRNGCDGHMLELNGQAASRPSEGAREK